MKPDYQKSHKRGKVDYMVLWLVCEREGGGFKQRRRIEGTYGLSNLDLLLLNPALWWMNDLEHHSQL
ncbi:hypothetical protein RHMOL_Rhmol02G0237600 [Rhododendron molle]|uniref:Uncharacterized protein n=1 Tax=Rhododendron molle TaxID=49168 RepID=A0ACC0PTV2_RHOML|nr:hypothetical protein RHMOL_Rhmol02G0237600 [Rhododendron molle]